MSKIQMSENLSFKDQENLKKEMIYELESLLRAAEMIHSNWEDEESYFNDTMSEDYPFSESFDEEVLRIRAWVENSIERIKKS